MIFSIFWVKTTGMDAAGQAKNIISSGLQLPGFRKDQRILESILNRYIMPLTVMGGLAIGALAAIANTLGVLTSGTAILLAVMITYQIYQNIAQQHAMDMHPALRKVIG
jgi:preprotein translocase subunit SecY